MRLANDPVLQAALGLSLLAVLVSVVALLTMILPWLRKRRTLRTRVVLFERDSWTVYAWPTAKLALSVAKDAASGAPDLTAKVVQWQFAGGKVLYGPCVVQTKMPPAAVVFSATGKVGYVPLPKGEEWAGANWVLA